MAATGYNRGFATAISTAGANKSCPRNHKKKGSAELPFSIIGSLQDLNGCIRRRKGGIAAKFQGNYYGGDRIQPRVCDGDFNSRSKQILPPQP
ncbi:MAG: hypothetical protein ACLFP1_05765 [Candidatus Goldiibacteriota bacterium]